MASQQRAKPVPLVVTERVRRLLERAVTAGVSTGAVAAWSRRGQGRHTVAVGHATRRRGRQELSGRAWFDLASMTKPLVVTTLCLMALRDRDLELETRVGEVLGEVRATALGRMNLRHLLTHTSGLPAWAPLYATCHGDPSRVFEALSSLPLQAPPGRHVVYSCMGFVVLGLILERTLGDRLDRLFDRRVLQPLGLEDELGFRPEPAIRQVVSGALRPAVEERMVRDLGMDIGLIPAPARGRPDDGNARFFNGVAGNSGLFGSAAGVIGLASCYLPGHGTLLSAREIALASNCYTHGLEQERGLGWQLAGTVGCSAGSALARSAFGHVGFSGTSVWIDPSRETVLTLLTNRHHPGHRELDLHPLRRRFHALVLA
jgi:CubicO group peptidase (beta-lactamase class C family)